MAAETEEDERRIPITTPKSTTAAPTTTTVATTSITKVNPTTSPYVSSDEGKAGLFFLTFFQNSARKKLKEI